MEHLMIKILYTCIALLFIISPVMAGIYGTLWFIRRKEIRKLRKSIEELRIKSKLLCGELSGVDVLQETSRDIGHATDSVSAGQSDSAVTTAATHKRKRHRPKCGNNRSELYGASGNKTAKA